MGDGKKGPGRVGLGRRGKGCLREGDGRGEKDRQADCKQEEIKAVAGMAGKCLGTVFVIGRVLHSSPFPSLIYASLFLSSNCVRKASRLHGTDLLLFHSRGADGPYWKSGWIQISLSKTLFTDN